MTITHKPPASAGYRSVKDEILRRIRSQAWPPGSLVPGEVELAAAFGVARGTVNRAMSELTAQGYLERKRKGGTRVRPSPLRAAKFLIPLVREEIEAKGAIYDYRIISTRQAPATRKLAAELGIEEGAPLLRTQCLHLADGKPYQLEDRWINLATLPEASEVDFSTVSPNEWLVKTVPYTDVQIRIGATTATRHVARLLETRPSVPLLRTARTTWLNGAAVTHVQLYFQEGYELVAHY